MRDDAAMSDTATPVGPRADPPARRRDDRHRDHRGVRAHRAAAGPVLAVVRGQRVGLRPQLCLVRPLLRHLVLAGRASSPSIGIVVSFLLCGVIAIAGKRGSAPTMILSRAAFGVNGQKVPGVDLVAGLDRLGDVPRDPRRARDLDDLHPPRLGRRHRHQGRRRRRRGRADRLGQRRRLPHHHADAVGADLDHRHRRRCSTWCSPSTTSTGRPCRTSRPARPRR